MISERRRSAAGTQALQRSSDDLADLGQACEAALSPISVRFLELGFGAGLFLQVAKRAYVNAAVAAIRRSGARPTHSRIAALTGLQRKEVKALLDGSSDNVGATARLPPIMRVLVGWRSDPDYQSSTGKPKPLAPEGDVSLRSLVDRYAGDVTHTAILRELERLGHVARRHDGRIELSGTGPELKEKLGSVEVFSSCIADYAVAMTGANATSGTGIYAGHRVAKTSDARLGAALARTFCKRAEDFLDSFERWASRSGREAGHSGVETGSSFALGIYLVERPSEEAQKAPAKRPSRPSKRA
jgi:hypothetical protein